jgi:hypothetical protein
MGLSAMRDWSKILLVGLLAFGPLLLVVAVLLMR